MARQGAIGGGEGGGEGGKRAKKRAISPQIVLFTRKTLIIDCGKALVPTDDRRAT